MANLIESIRGKLLNISREKKISFEELFQRYGAEQFLARLSASPFLERFIFKGGSLLSYLIDTQRQTKDLDFSIRQISNKVEEASEIMTNILSIPMEDGLTWDTPAASSLNHPEMDYPGVRIKCLFYLGKSRGTLRIDMAIGEEVKAKKIALQRLRYRGQAFIGPDFDILAYPPEAIFAEKLQIAIKRGEQNTRMKDYYDLWKLSRLDSLDPSLVRSNMESIFNKRQTKFAYPIDFGSSSFEKLQGYWASFVRKMKIEGAPSQLKDLVQILNQRLEFFYQDE